MTERDWLTCGDPEPMLEFLRGRASARKLRLFACACCRRGWHLLRDEQGREAVAAAERYADWPSGIHFLAAAHERLAGSRHLFEAAEAASSAAGWAAAADAEAAALHAATWAAVAVGATAGGEAASTAEQAAQADLVRDLFGNPFRPVSLDPSWLAQAGGSVATAAQRIYAERDFGSLPALADALSAAGCDDAAVFAHCRGGGPHVRGCWVLDWVLGKD